MMSKPNDADNARPALDCVHHIAFVVHDLTEAIPRFEKILGISVAERGPVHTRGAEVAIFRLKNVNLEVVAPATPDSSLRTYLERHGEGFFHIAFSVEDVEAASPALTAAGLPMAGDPYTAYKDWRIAYLDTDATGGIRMHIIDADAE